MFDRISPSYDRMNLLMSMGRDGCWRRLGVRASGAQPGDAALDVCCGTGDLLLALAKEKTKECRAPMGSDFCHPMLVLANQKIAGRQALLFESDALALPVKDASLDLVTVAFGFRNLANYEAGLREMRRVLRPGGMAAILEFTTPPNRAFGAIYHLYCRRVLPWIGGMITGSREAYQYLPESVRKFPGARDLAEKMSAAGFAKVEFEYLTGGIVALHLGRV
jgi:demethylmenaquinone methyltransferase/2-methoxy-6-polyprenyl-1,4-benzoquinol methylase